MNMHLIYNLLKQGDHCWRHNLHLTVILKLCVAIKKSNIFESARQIQFSNKFMICDEDINKDRLIGVITFLQQFDEIMYNHS